MRGKYFLQVAAMEAEKGQRKEKVKSSADERKKRAEERKFALL